MHPVRDKKGSDPLQPNEREGIAERERERESGGEKIGLDEPRSELRVRQRLCQRKRGEQSEEREKESLGMSLGGKKRRWKPHRRVTVNCPQPPSLASSYSSRFTCIQGSTSAVFRSASLLSRVPERYLSCNAWIPLLCFPPLCKSVSLIASSLSRSTGTISFVVVINFF